MQTVGFDVISCSVIKSMFAYDSLLDGDVICIELVILDLKEHLPMMLQ